MRSIFDDYYNEIRDKLSEKYEYDGMVMNFSTITIFSSKDNLENEAGKCEISSMLEFKSKQVISTEEILDLLEGVTD